MEALLEATKERLKLKVCIENDATRCDRRSTSVNFVLPGSIEESFKLFLSNEEVTTSFRNQKNLQPWTVCKAPLSDARGLSELIFIVLPAWQGEYNKLLSSRLQQALREAMQMASSETEVIFASFSTNPFNYPVDFYAHQMICFLTDAAGTGQKEPSRVVTLFTEDTGCKAMFEEQLRSFGFQFDYEQLLLELPVSDHDLAPESSDHIAFLNQLFDDVHKSESSEMEPWKKFLSETNWTLAEPLFVGFLRRVTAVLSETCVSDHFSLSTNKDISVLCKISNSNFVLNVLYRESAQPNKLVLHRHVADHPLFVKYCMEFSCIILKFSDVKIWVALPIGFVALILWSLPSRPDLIVQLENNDALSGVMKALQYVCVQDLSKENVFTHAVWLNLLILYHCVANAFVPSFYDNVTGFYNVLLNIAQHAPDKELTIICKALLTRLLVVGNGSLDDAVLQNEEINIIIIMLQSDLPEPMCYHGLSFVMLFSALTDLAAIADNREKLLKRDILPVLAELSDKLPPLEQEAAVKVVSIYLHENYGISDIILAEPHTGIAKDEGSFVHSEELILKDDAACYICNVLLHYITKSLAPCKDHSLNELGDELEHCWYSIAVAMSLMQLLCSESDEATRDSMLQVVMSYPSIFTDLLLAYQIESSHQVLKHVLEDIAFFLVLCSDHSQLSHLCARSGILFLPTTHLHTARLLSNFDEKFVLFSLQTLLNCALNGQSYPAFYFAETLVEIKAFIKLPTFKLASLAKFTLSCFVQYLDCYELLDLKLTKAEANFCVDSLSQSTRSTNLQGEVFSAYESLVILTNFTHPYFFHDNHPSKDEQTAESKEVKRRSLFSKNMSISLDALKHNFLLLMVDELFNSIKVLLKSEEKQIQEKCIQLVWNMIHYAPAKQKLISEYKEIVSIIDARLKSTYVEVHNVSYCVLHLLDVTDSADSKLKYARICFLYENYFEAATVCSEVILTASDCNLVNQARLLKGKALFYMYQPKICYLMKHKQELQKVEEKILQDECFTAMKETIQMLCSVLDSDCIDSEGSKLLDWAMMDCVRETNRLNLCRRCLMCRTSKDLRRSHIWPKFILQRVSKSKENISSSTSIMKRFTFGLEKHQIKSSGECWFWMLCGDCEEILAQNAENDFSVKFPKEITAQTFTYGSWFFNYCCAILLRTLAFIKFPRCYNDDEVYDTFVYCRNYLLSLRVKIKKTDVFLAKQNLWLYSTNSLQFKPYVVLMPSTIAMQETNAVIQPGIMSCNWLAPHRLIDGMRDFSGFSHYFAACCNCVCIVIKFTPSLACLIPERYEVALSSGNYTIEDEKVRVDSIPNGLWMLWNRMLLLDNVNIAGLMRGLSTGAAKKLLSKNQGPDVFIPSIAKLTINNSTDEMAIKVPYPVTSVKRINFLPAGFMLAEPGLYSTEKQIQFPSGHQVLCHDTFKGPNQFLLCFLAVGCSDAYPSNKPYVLFVLSGDNKVEYLDGAFLTISEEGKIQLSDFFLNHEMVNAVRLHHAEHHALVVDAVSGLLTKAGMLTLPMLILYLQCRCGIKGIHDLPAFACKCSSHGCWYCQDLCHYCLKPAMSSCTLSSSTIRYCSDTCRTLLCIHPKEMSKNMFVFNHCVEGDKYSGMSMLDILKICRADNSDVNQFELLHVCVEQRNGNPFSSTPYIIWQKRFVHSQLIGSFYISERCGIVSPFNEDSSEMATEVTKSFWDQEHVLKNLINIAMQSLGYDNFSAFLFHCLKVLDISQSEHTGERAICDQDVDKTMLLVSVTSLPSPKLIIPEHFIKKGVCITISQCVEIKVDLTLSDNLYVDVRVTTPFTDEFELSLQIVNKDIRMGQFIPAFRGEYTLHISLLQSVTGCSLKLDALNIPVTVF